MVARNPWRSLVPRNAARVQVPVVLHARPCRPYCGSGVGLPLLCFRREGWNSAIRRIDNEPRAPVRPDRTLPRVHSVLFPVVVDGRWIHFSIEGDRLPECVDGLFFRVKRFVRQG